MQSFVTTGCGRHGHREMRIQLAEPSPIPNVQRFLLDYFEGSVASGNKFLPGQVIKFGWTLLRVCDRADGTLGIQQRERSPQMPWVELVDHALADIWLQKEVCASVGLDLAFPSEDDHAFATACSEQATDVMFARLPDGWALRCAQDHDHGDLQTVPLIAVAAIHPVLVQLFALPPGTSVWVPFVAKRDAPEGALRVEPHVFRNGHELEPKPGSYLAALQR